MSTRIGFHVSIAGSISKSVDNALKIGCSAFQIFTRNPRGWSAKPIDREDVKLFKSKLSNSNIQQNSVAVHMPYLPNLSAPDGEMYKKSVNILTEEVYRCSVLDIPYLVIHFGSHLGKGTESGINQVVKACNFAFDSYRSTYRRITPVMILLENSAGQKNSIGSKFEEIRLILDRLHNKQIGICLDTCHAFSCGYDLRTELQVEENLDHFNNTIGLKELKLIHLNDSKGDIDSRLDRHEHIGIGKIGETGVAALLRHSKIKNLPIIMETPINDIRGDPENLKVVASLIGCQTKVNEKERM
jgi:deoxyribonuclease-4